MSYSEKLYKLSILQYNNIFVSWRYTKVSRGMGGMRASGKVKITALD